MEFRELKTFQAVASLLSFRKAADVLNYAQSTVSSQIQSLENSLGTSLFRRSGNKICLTPSGVKLFKYSQRLINLEDEIQSNFKTLNETTGNLIIKIPHSVAAYYLPPMLKQFQSDHPAVGFDFDGCVGQNVYSIFQAGLIDIAFLFHDNFSDNHLYVEELAKVELGFVTNPENDEFNGVINSAEDFRDKTLLLSMSDCSYRMIFEKMLIEANVKLRNTIVYNNPEVVKRMLLSGCKGIALLPEAAYAGEAADGTLKKLEWRGPAFNAKLYMIWKKEKFQTDATKLFVRAVRDYFGKTAEGS